MRIRILWPGKTKDRSAAEWIEKYLRRLRPLAEVGVVEVKEEKGAAVAREGERILRQSRCYVLLDERGREMTSVEFASFLEGRAEADFVVGGAHGVSAEVRRGAALTMALSRMTLTHEMARVLLLEQIYRALMIARGGGYHH
jgi:23S rRNA (pseudouridine1915-N3)-methyltransferase